MERPDHDVISGVDLEYPHLEQGIPAQVNLPGGHPGLQLPDPLPTGGLGERGQTR